MPGVSNASLQQHCDGTFFSILQFVFSAIKGPAKELKLSFMLGEKYVNKIFLLNISTLELHELLVVMTPAEDFFQFTPPPESLTPLPPEFPESHLSWGGWIFSGTTQFPSPPQGIALLTLGYNSPQNLENFFQFFAIFTLPDVTIVKVFNGDSRRGVRARQKSCPNILSHGVRNSL